jgi:glycosyltransferase involved in cell wall biosynthesis
MSRQIVKDTIEAGCPGSRAILIPNGIALRELKKPCEPPFDFSYILSLGRLDSIKGVDLLLKSFQELCRHDSSIKLFVTGTCPALHSLVDQTLSLRIGHRVIFTGTKTGCDKAALFQHCRFFVCPSRTESLGNANIEALACGKPVIAYRVGGIPDVIQNEVNGFLVTPYNTSEFADRMLDLLKYPDNSYRMGEAGKKIAQDYDWPIIARLYIEAYEKAVKNRAKKIRN